MKINKVVMSADASERLRQLKARTGLTPNILCRIGLCMSLAEPGIPDPAQYPEDDLEFNRYTLLGDEWDELYVGLLRQRMAHDGISDDAAADQLRAHLNRGVLALGRVAKSISDIARLSGRTTLLSD